MSRFIVYAQHLFRSKKANGPLPQSPHNLLMLFGPFRITAGQNM